MVMFVWLGSITVLESFLATLYVGQHGLTPRGVWHFAAAVWTAMTLIQCVASLDLVIQRRYRVLDMLKHYEQN